jgi:NAD(P)-dependent dehydrogenase (short-subunit alcohol dehydrogenase family)
MTASTEAGEIAVVTGASTDIGAATAHELARRGYHVLAGVRRDRDADAIRGPGIEPLIIDITDADHIGALTSRVRDDSRAVRALVNNAGIGVNVPFEAYPIDEWRRLFEVNLFGHVAVTQALLTALIRSKGGVARHLGVGCARRGGGHGDRQGSHSAQAARPLHGRPRRRTDHPLGARPARPETRPRHRRRPASPLPE